MKNLKYFSIYLWGALMATACYKDIGNYDYTPISDILIEEVADMYTVVLPLDDKLEITPLIITSYPESELEYAWVRCKGSVSSGFVWDTISREKNLHHPIEERMGSYPLYFYVKNKKSGFFVHTVTNMTILSEYSRGFYMLKETADGDTDIDLLLDDGRIGTDILVRTQGTPLQGKPRSLGIMYQRQMIDPDTHEKSRGHSIGIVTFDKKVNILRTSDMYLAFEHETLFYDEPDDIPYKFLGCSGGHVYLSSTGVYPISLTSDGSGYLGFPTATVNVSHYAYSIGTHGYLCWDDITDGIVLIGSSGAVTRYAHVDYGDFSAFNSECIAMGGLQNVAFAILKSKTSGLMTLYKFSVSSSLPTLASITNIPPTSGLYNASLITFNEKVREVIYFVVNNKLFCYDVALETESEIFPAGLPEDEMITYIRNCHYDLDTPAFSYFVVGTGKGGLYRVHMYNMTTDGRPLGEAVVTASGTGKVQDIGYIGTSYVQNAMSLSGGFLGRASYNYSR